MPAAAVIPAPIAYIQVVAVKKLVVGSWGGVSGPPSRVCTAHPALSAGDAALDFIGWGAESAMLL